MHQLGTKAIMSDLINVSWEVDVAHKTGVNVLYGNGAAKWVPRDFLVRSSDGSSLLIQDTNPGQFDMDTWADMEGFTELWNKFDAY